MGTEIIKLQPHIRDFINDKKIDKNADGKINKDNGELADLLSQTGAKRIKDLMSETPDNAFLTFILGTTAVGAGFAAGANRLARVEKPLANVHAVMSLCCMGITIMSVLFGKSTKENKHFELNNVEQQDVKVVPEQQENKTELQNVYKNAFASLEVNEDVPLKEYVPQKGEYWTSILKAKYGVDDETALKMANKIKEMIYGDAKAAKQSPIMYLPQVWEFEGNTYNYNNNAVPEKTTEYSDDVKTEQGKMTKELEY